MIRETIPQSMIQKRPKAIRKLYNKNRTLKPKSKKISKK